MWKEKNRMKYFRIGANWFDYFEHLFTEIFVGIESE